MTTKTKSLLCGLNGRSRGIVSVGKLQHRRDSVELGLLKAIRCSDDILSDKGALCYTAWKNNK